jgi:UDP-N-acetylmuramate dehydrogenase
MFIGSERCYWIASMLDEGAKQWLTALLGPAVKFDESLAEYTSFRIGGPADAMAQPENESQLKQLIRWAQQYKVPYMVMGDGSNLLVRDGGIRGLVIRMGSLAGGVKWAEKSPRVRVTAGAGVPTKRLCSLALRNGWQGMNFALGIPGTLGGAIMMNAGTAQGSIADVLTAVSVMTAAGDKIRIERGQLKIQYRNLQWPADIEREKEQTILLKAELRLTMANRDQIWRQARRMMKARASRQPSWQPSAGCFFKNPSDDKPAGRLIDGAGLKGLRVGDAQVSLRHANFIINRGNASAQQVLSLAKRIQNKVKANCGIELQPEVRIVGAEAGEKESL